MTIVAIDGPAGAGKSSVGRAVATRLGWRFVDTGAMYRAVALRALERSLDLGDADALQRLAAKLNIDVSGERTIVDGDDVTDAIRRPDVSAAASRVSEHPRVRAALVEAQREYARRGSVVMEGRDIASAVVPYAEVKVFLTASLDERARRRARQAGLGESSLGDLERSLAARDEADAARAASPLTRVPDALVIDSTGVPFDDVVDAIVQVTRRVEGL